MDTSKFIAIILGVCFLASGLGYILSGQHWRNIFKGFSEPSVSTFLFSLVLIVVGMAIVKYHNIWQSWKIWITLYGWICLIKGTLFLIFPNSPSSFIHLLDQAPNTYFLGGGIVNILIGLMYGYFGLMHKATTNSTDTFT